MPRPVTLFTGQWADLTLDELAAMAKGWGYDGLELACWGDHFDVQRALAEPGYCRGRHDLLARHGLKVWAISNHLVGQAVCDPIDVRHKTILPARIWGDGDAEGVRQRAAREMIDTARAAAKLGVGVVNGFTGSSVWHKLYFFPPTSAAEVDEGYADFARRWGPILKAFDEAGVRFGLEVHPTEIAYDIHTARRAPAPPPPQGVRVQLRPIAPDLAGDRPGEVHRCVPRSDLPLPREGCDPDAGWDQQHPGVAPRVRGCAARVGLPYAGAGRGEL
jgi:hypothetical protein